MQDPLRWSFQPNANNYQPISTPIKPYQPLSIRALERTMLVLPSAGRVTNSACCGSLTSQRHMLGHISRTLKPNKNYIKTKSHHHTIEKDGSTYCEQNIFTASCAWAPLMSSRVAPRLTTCYHNFQLQTPNGSKWSHLEAPT